MRSPKRSAVTWKERKYGENIILDLEFINSKSLGDKDSLGLLVERKRIWRLKIKATIFKKFNDKLINDCNLIRCTH